MTACDFEFVAYAVTVRIVQAIAITVVAIFGVRARTVIVRRGGIVVTCLSVRAAFDFEFVTHTIAVSVVQAVAVAIVTGIGIRT